MKCASGDVLRVIASMREEGISVILISQGSSEHSICFAVPEAEAERAERVVRRAFEPELRRNDRAVAGLQSLVSGL